MFGFSIVPSGTIPQYLQGYRKFQAEIAELEAQIEALKRGKIPEHVKGDCETVFTHNGHSYYQFKELHEMPYGRAQHLETIQELQSLKVTDEMLEKFGEDLIKFGNASKFNEVFRIINQLADRLKLKATPDYILEMAAIVYIRDDEDYKTYDPAFGARKIRDWKKNPEVVNFFLLRSFRKFYKLGELSQARALSLLKELDVLDHKTRPDGSATNYTSFINPRAISFTQSPEDQPSK